MKDESGKEVRKVVKMVEEVAGASVRLVGKGRSTGQQKGRGKKKGKRWKGRK
jgi:hypothetical protein